MKTQEGKLRHVKETAGECWHVFERFAWSIKCKRCGITFNTECGKCNATQGNPSPDDLNELFRLAEKLFTKGEMFINSITFCPKFGSVSILIENPDWLSVDLVSFKRDTFLNALFIATGGKDGSQTQS